MVDMMTSSKQPVVGRSGSGNAAEKEDKKPLLSILRGDKFRQAHVDWIVIENFSVKFHGGTAFSKWVLWCEETAMKIASSTGSDRKNLVEAARSRANEPLPVAVLQSLKRGGAWLLRPSTMPIVRRRFQDFALP